MTPLSWELRPAAGPAATRVGLMCFRVAGQRAAIAAGDVVAVGEPAPGQPRLADLLGHAAPPAPGERALRLRSGADVVVEGPLALISVGIGDVLALPACLSRPPLLGAAQLGGELVILIDARSLP